MSPTLRHPACGKPAFSLTEMVAVMATMVMLMAAAVNLIHGTGPQSRKTATDMLAGMIEQARTAALTSRSCIVLAMAEPADFAGDAQRCRLAIFMVDAWPDDPAHTVKGTMMGRWRSFESGVVLIGGATGTNENPIDARKLTITCDSPQPFTARVHAIAINPYGGLIYPPGAAPVVMRIAEGGYPNGIATPTRHGPSGTIAENRLKIGRVTARPYRIDG
jgi:hypothetical protein